jgi:hypothetical protein
MRKLFEHYVFIVLITPFLFGCEPYRVLRVISTDIEHKVSDSKADYFVIDSDTIKISCDAFYSDHDSLTEFVVIIVLAHENDNKWIKEKSYHLSDRIGYHVESKDLRKNPNQVFPNKYLYEIVFDSKHKLLLPLHLMINDIEKEEYNIDFGL